MQLRIVCPEECVFEGEAAYVAVPSSDGDFGILPRHSSEICTVKNGYVRISDTQMGVTDHVIAVSEGFVQVANAQIIILAERGVDMATVDADAVRAKQAGFEESLRNLPAWRARRRRPRSPCPRRARPG